MLEKFEFLLKGVLWMLLICNKLEDILRILKIKRGLVDFFGIV